MITNEYKYKTEPFEHQIRAERFIAERQNYFALFMEQGTGKTKVMIDFLENSFPRINRVLLIAPNGVHRQWMTDEVPKHGWLVSRKIVWRSGEKSKKQLSNYLLNPPDDELCYLAVNVEAFSVRSYLDLFKRFVKSGRTFIVIDEATSIKNKDASRTYNITYALNDLEKRGKVVTKVVYTSVGRAILTGTPTPKGAYGLWSMFEFLHTNYFNRGYYSFKGHFGIEQRVLYETARVPTSKPIDTAVFKAIRKAHEQGWAVEEIARRQGMSMGDVQYIIDNPQVNTPYKNLKELREYIDKRAFTVKKEDCLDLPSKLYERRYVTMNDEQRRVYKEMVKNAWTVYQDGALDASNKLTIQTRLRQISGGFFPSKYDLSDGNEALNEHVKSVAIGTPSKYMAIEEMLEANDVFPLIIACAFVAEADYCYEHLSKKYRVGKITGSVERYARQKTENEFKNGDLDVLVATSSTIAKGYNFQMSHNMWFYSNTYNTEDRMQIEDRIHRIGQTEKCTYVDILTEDSLDDGVLAVLNGDKQFQEYLRSNDGGDFFKLIGENND